MRKFITLSSLILCSFHSFAQSPQLDYSFGGDGIVKADLGSRFKIGSSGQQVLTGPGGSIYILSNNPTFISRRLPNGSADSTYGINGYSSAVDFNDAHAAMQADGKIIIVGANFGMSRMNVNGKPDSTFGNNSTQKVFDENYSASGVAVQSDGKIVAAGTYLVNNNAYFIVARFNPDGSTDHTFNDSGKVITDFGFRVPPQLGNDTTVTQYANAVAIQQDGKIVVGGYVYTGITEDFALARYNSDGRPDSTFNSNGRQLTNFGSLDYGSSLAIDHNGKIVFSGVLSSGANYNIGIARYNNDGTLDNSFSGAGKRIIFINTAAITSPSLAIRNDNKMVVGETISLPDGTNDFEVIRLNTNGSFDNTFDADGIVTTDIASSDDYLYSVAVQDDDKTLVTGMSYIPSETPAQTLTALRYNTDGQLDNTFADNGKLKGVATQGFTAFNAHAIQADGKIVAVGETWNGSDYDFVVARYNIDGKPDSTFNGTGIQTTNFGGSDEAVSVVIQGDQKIVVAGTGDQARFEIARYNADGSLDNTFNGVGKVLPVFGIGDVCSSVALQSDGKIVVAGYSYIDPGYDSSYFAVARFNVNGTPDLSFNGDGKQLTDFGNHLNFASSVAIQNDGKIVVAGNSYINNFDQISIARYTTDGALDTTFSHDGKELNSFGSQDNFGMALAIQNDGKILVGSYTETVSPTTSAYVLVRYNINGDLDTSFNHSGFQTRLFDPGFNFVRAIAINNDGRIAVGGSNGNHGAVVLYKNNGTFDSTFGNNGLLVTDLALGMSTLRSLSFTDDRLYVAGYGLFPGQLGVIARYIFPQSGSLPVSLLDFTGSLRNKSVLLQWKVATEKNLAKYVIERSPDGNRFLPINSVASKGSGSSAKDYSVVDDQPFQGINFYRLKMVDIDGKFTYSNIVAVKINAGNKLLIFPNPVQRILFVEASGDNQSAVAQIVDAGGRKMKEVKISLSGVTSFSIDISDLSSGFYNLVLRTNGKTEVRTFIKK